MRLVSALTLAACATRVESATQSDTTLVPRGGDAPTLAIVREAASAIAHGRAYEATRALAPVLADRARRSSEAMLVAAAAAAQWGGWTEVERLLAREPWVDTLYEGRARELLARAALGRGADSLAKMHAERAVKDARDESMRGVRLVLLARSLDRLAATDSAARVYLDAADALPSVADWLTLRAAGATSARRARVALYERIRTDVARGRIGITEAQSLARTGDHAAAAAAYDSLQQPARALRMRLLALGSTADSAARLALRGDALALLERTRASSEAREAIALLDEELGPLTSHEALRVARRAATVGLDRRAATGFAAALAAGPLGAADRMAYGAAFARLGENRAAAAQLARVPASDRRGPDAAYLRARSLVRAGEGAEGRALLRRIAGMRGAGTEVSANARFLLAELASDDGHDRRARDAYRALAKAYPASRVANESRFRAAIIAFADGAHAAAARELDSLAARDPRGDQALAALYWSGRASAAAGRTAAAHERWREVIRRNGASYYALTSARRLGEQPWTPPPETTTGDTSANERLAAAIRRLDVLSSLGMDAERDLEIEWLSDAATGAGADRVERELATADAFGRGGLPWRAIRLAHAALAAGAPRDRRAYGLRYPLPYGDLIPRAATARRLDPALVAALIHQESGFNPRATSGAGARGLMQVLPSVGREIARGRDFPVWTPALLYEPDVSVELGTTHLATMLARYPDLAYALAAYNAGQSPVRRWRTLRGTDDPELFIERIPYDETRDYVRILLRNRAMYAALYDWS